MTEPTLHRAYAQILGREPTDDEIRRVYDLCNAFGIRHNDAILTIVLLCQYHLHAINAVPQTLPAAADEVLQRFRACAETIAHAAVQQGQATLVQVSTDTMRQVARDTTRKEKVKWIAGCTVVVAVALALAIGYVHHQAYAAGVRHGERVGYDKAQDEKAAASWANTREGKAAWRLAQANPSRFMTELEACTWGSGWRRKKSDKRWICWPRPKDGTVRGWWVP